MCAHTTPAKLRQRLLFVRTNGSSIFEKLSTLMMHFALIIVRKIGTPGIWVFRLEKRLQSTSVETIWVIAWEFSIVLWDHVGRHNFGGIGIALLSITTLSMSTVVKRGYLAWKDSWGLIKHSQQSTFNSSSPRIMTSISRCATAPLASSMSPPRKMLGRSILLLRRRSSAGLLPDASIFYIFPSLPFFFHKTLQSACLTSSRYSGALEMCVVRYLMCCFFSWCLTIQLLSKFEVRSFDGLKWCFYHVVRQGTSFFALIW